VKHLEAGICKILANHQNLQSELLLQSVSKKLLLLQSPARLGCILQNSAVFRNGKGSPEAL